MDGHSIFLTSVTAIIKQHIYKDFTAL